MTKVKWPMLSLKAHGKTTCPIDDSDLVYDPVKKTWSMTWHPEKFIGLETLGALLQESGKKIELEWYFKAIYREQPTPDGRITIREKYYVPTNPHSTPQELNRQKFADAITAWGILTSTEQIIWNKLKYPEHMSGYNRFIRAFMRGEI